MTRIAKGEPAPEPEPGPEPAQKRLDPDRRKAQLLKHALAAFAEAGIERAVHADVASRAKVSTPTVFKYFPTREALVDAVLSEVELAFKDLGALKSTGIKLQPTALIQILSELVSKLCSERPNLMKVALTWSVAFSPIRERFKDFENTRLDDLQSFLSAPEISRSDARIFFSSMFLFVRMHFDGTTEDARKKYVERICEMFAVTYPIS